MGINGKWTYTYTTTTTTGDPIEINAPGWKTGDIVEINNPTVEKPKGWICPRCGRVNAPWVASCSCNGSVFKKIDTWTETGIPEACRNCSNHPSNGGSGICFCTLGTYPITC